MNEHFYNGFIKRAQEYGLSVVEADSLIKQARDFNSVTMRMLIPQLIGAASGGALGHSQGHPLMGSALGQLLGMSVGIPWGLHHLKQRSKNQYKDKNTNKLDREALEHYYPELKENQV